MGAIIGAWKAVFMKQLWYDLSKWFIYKIINNSITVCSYTLILVQCNSRFSQRLIGDKTELRYTFTYFVINSQLCVKGFLLHDVHDGFASVRTAFRGWVNSDGFLCSTCILFSVDVNPDTKKRRSSYRCSTASSAEKERRTPLTCDAEYNSWPPCTYFEWVCLVMLRIVAPSLPMIAPTNCVGTSMRSGMSDCTLGRAPKPGEPDRGGPRALKPLRPPAGGPSGAAVSSGM